MTARSDGSPRTEAALAVAAVVGRGESLATRLPPVLQRLTAGNARALAQELTYGTLRWYFQLDAAAAQLLTTPLRRRDLDLHCLILIGLYQLAHLEIPEHAVVAETVHATRLLGKAWASGLVNGVLRSFQRDRERYLTAAGLDEQARLAHPAWLLQRYQADWPQAWEVIAASGNARPPMSLRVNARQRDRTRYARELQAAGIASRPAAHAAQALILEQPVEVSRLPGFGSGVVSVQDVAAQLAAPLLQCGPAMRVLDACAAPGSKACHVLEVNPRLGSLVALDLSPQRLERVRDNLRRLHLHAVTVCGDATQPRQWWDGTRFDRILLDAPCSGTGVIRRHPDIKILRHADDLAALTALQQQMLSELWPLLVPDGILLYSTCSVLREENDQQIGRFLDAHPDASELPIADVWGHTAAHGRQVLPGEDAMDGFYYAAILKR